MATTRVTTEPAWVIRLAFELTGNDQEAEALCGGLSEAQLNWQPAPSCWSVGQCLEHICITNDKYLVAIEGALQGKPDAAVEQITLGPFAGWFLRKFVEPSPHSNSVGAPGKIKPSEKVGTEILERFLASNRACRELIVGARSKNVNRIRFWNPILPGIRFTVGAGFELISSLERRHLLQAERVRDSANFPR